MAGQSYHRLVGISRGPRVGPLSCPGSWPSGAGAACLGLPPSCSSAAIASPKYGGTFAFVSASLSSWAASRNPPNSSRDCRPLVHRPLELSSTKWPKPYPCCLQFALTRNRAAMGFIDITPPDDSPGPAGACWTRVEGLAGGGHDSGRPTALSDSFRVIQRHSPFTSGVGAKAVLPECGPEPTFLAMNRPSTQ